MRKSSSRKNTRRVIHGPRVINVPNDIALAKILGARIKAARELEGLNQQDLSKKSGIPSSQISEYETGSRLPTVQRLLQVAIGLNSSLDYLVGHTPK